MRTTRRPCRWRADRFCSNWCLPQKPVCHLHLAEWEQQQQQRRAVRRQARECALIEVR